VAVRTFGTLIHDGGQWVITELEPHVAIRLKAIFSKVPESKPVPIELGGTDEIAQDLEWFIARYPLAISDADRALMTKRAHSYREVQEDLNLVMAPHRAPREFKLNGSLREYQARGVELFLKTKRLLIGDSVGLGKTLEAIGALTDPRTLPALIVVQAHLTKQWSEQVVRFLSMRTHVIKGTRPYQLPPADVYITTYSRLSGWVDVFEKGTFQTVVFDECQELRRSESQKSQAARVVSWKAEFALGLSATPVYNYGDEIFNVYKVLKPGALGSFDDFAREWCGYAREVKNPKALGTYLREQHLFLRRTRADVGRELPPVNKIIHTVGHDEEAVEKVEQLARSLAIRVTSGSFTERGEAARELDIMMRLVTGVSKAKFVAAYVRILLENGEPVLLAGWHRDVYDIWLKELADFKPVMYTGSESANQKAAAKDAFVNGLTNLMIISLRSGIGLDGLQKRCSYVVVGELDWSPAVLEQLIGRVDRDGQPREVTAIILVSDGGSDPLLVDMLGLKASQAAGIVDPLGGAVDVHSDDSRIKALAKYVLSKRSGADGDVHQNPRQMETPRETGREAVTEGETKWESRNQASDGRSITRPMGHQEGNSHQFHEQQLLLTLFTAPMESPLGT
jgi:hypothetical protein